MAILQTLFRQKHKNESWVKYVFYLLHLWLGVLSSAVLTIVCLTGAIYSTKPLVENVSHHKLAKLPEITSEQQELPLITLLEEFEARFEKTPNMLKTEPGYATLVSNFKRGEKSTAAYLNPYTAQVVGKPNEKISTFYNVIMRLHRWLLVREPGKTIVGISVLIFVFLLLSGLVLWWPSKKSQVKKAFVLSIKNARVYKTLYELHRVFGFYFILPLLFLSITGLYISYDWVKNGVTLALGGEVVERSHGPRRQTNALKNKTASFKQEEKIESENTPEKTVFPEIDTPLLKVKSLTTYGGATQIFLPREPGGDTRFTRYNTTNLLKARFPDRFTVKENGELETTLFKDQPLSKQVATIMKGLHTSELFPGWMGILYCIVSLFGTLLPLTGLWMWIKRATV